VLHKNQDSDTIGADISGRSFCVAQYGVPVGAPIFGVHFAPCSGLSPTVHSSDVLECSRLPIIACEQNPVPVSDRNWKASAGAAIPAAQLESDRVAPGRQNRRFFLRVSALIK
jgi:hypothetical protein